jgi:hypothetical protein
MYLIWTANPASNGTKVGDETGYASYWSVLPCAAKGQRTQTKPPPGSGFGFTGR